MLVRLMDLAAKINKQCEITKERGSQMNKTALERLSSIKQYVFIKVDNVKAQEKLLKL